jgi:dipeptidyl aminopeptidase/acylaminoacyl peptidase
MKKIMMIVILIVIAAVPSSAERHITFNDLYAYPMIEEFELSPDGGSIVMSVTEYDTIDGGSDSDLYLLDTKTGAMKKLTNNPAGASSPRWSPDGGSIAFISDRGGKSQVWMIDVGGGEAYEVTSISTGVSGIEWSPDGGRFIFRSRVYSHCQSDSCNQAEIAAREKRKTSGQLYDRLMFRHYNHWDDGKVNHIFVHDLETGITGDLTPGEYNAPTAALGGDPLYTFSPDGQEICFVMNTDPEPAISTNNDLFIIPVGGGKPRRITENRANDSGPVYSPDGKFIAYRAMSRPGYEADKNDLVLYDRQAGKRTVLTDGFKLSAGDLIWTEDSRHIYFTAIDRGWVSLFAVDIRRGKIDKVITGAVRWNYRLSPDGKSFYYVKILPDNPGEIYVYNLKSKKEKRLTRFTEPLFSDLKLSKIEHFRFIGADGDSIHGMLTYPPDFDPNRRYPLVLLIHGGPQWAWLDEFNYYGWNKHLVAAQEYVVAQIDPHGSSGYGIEFKETVSKDWGGKDYEDLMKGVDYLIAEYDFIDADKLAALGRSYGGYMVNWIEAQTDRFDCLICVDGAFDLFSAYYTTDELWFKEWELGGTPWENPQFYRERSPFTYAENFKTPMLIVHGQRDYRVDLCQAVGMFTVLQRLGIDSRLLYFPDEGHQIHDINNIRYFYEVQFEWLGRFLK